MQVLNLDAELNISRLDADIRTLRLGEGGTTNYNDLTNKPSINSVTLAGNKTTTDLNIKTSDLVNDAGFITNADIPTKTSDLINDDGFQTAAQVSSAVAAAIPTEVSAFTNDAGYITAAQVGNIPTKTSDLDNDSGFITSAQAPVQSVNGYTGAVNLVASDIEVSAGVTVADGLSDLALSMPTKTSDLVNDSGFITSLNVPSKTSDLVNDSGFVTNQIDDSTTADTSTWSSNKIISYIASIPQTATITDTPVASFTDGADNVPVSSLIVDIDAVQAGSGTPSPDNVRAISGWSDCNIHKSGINLWDEEWEVGDIDRTTGNDAYSSTQIRTKNYMSCVGGKNYYIKIGGSNESAIAIIQYDVAKNFIQANWKADGNIITMNENTRYFRFTSNSVYGATYNNDISINYPATDTSYHSYNGGTDTISLGQTVYGGSLNVSTGLLTITHGYVDLGALNYTYSSGCMISNALVNAGSVGAVNSDNPVICEVYKTKAKRNWASAYNDGECGLSVDGTQLIFKDSDYSDPATFKSAMSGKKLIYELAVPTSAQLTPTEVRTLLNCNIFADTGNINELVYFKTGCEAIARLIEAYT